jgi:hypothetical protein
LLGGSTASASQPPVVARADLSPLEGGRWRAQLLTTQGDRSARRTIDGETCGEVADATALLLALMIDPAAGAGPVASATPPAASSASATPPEPTPADAGSPSVPASPVEPVESLRFAAGVGAAGDLGSLPKASYGPAATFALLRGPLRLQLGAAYFIPSESSPAGSPPAWGSVSLLAGTLSACAALLPSVGAGLCAGAELGSMRGRSFGVLHDDTVSTTWAAASLMGDLAFSVSDPVWIRLQAGGATPLGKRPQFVLDRGGTPQTVDEPSKLVGRASLAAEYHFP